MNACCYKLTTIASQDVPGSKGQLEYAHGWAEPVFKDSFVTGVPTTTMHAVANYNLSGMDGQASTIWSERRAFVKKWFTDAGFSE